MLDSQNIADEAVAKILDDLKDRKGLGDEWYQIDSEIQQEISELWKFLVMNAIGNELARVRKLEGEAILRNLGVKA